MKEVVNHPVHVGVKFVKRAGMWCLSINYNKENVADKLEWFHTEQEAKNKLVVS